MNGKRTLEDEFDQAQLRAVAEQVLARHALEVMPTPDALHKLGFRPQAEGSAELRWDARERRRTLLVDAAPGPVRSAWHLTGQYKADGSYRRVEFALGEREPVGKVALRLLDMWRKAYGPSARPPGPLDIGRIYEQHREKLGRLDLGLPRLVLDGPAFRKVRGRMRQRERGAGGTTARLSAAKGMLRIETVYSIYGVPAKGGLGLDCLVPVADLLTIPDTCMRGASIGLDRGWATLVIDWYCIRILNPSPEAQGPSVYQSLLTGTYAPACATEMGSRDELDPKGIPHEKPARPATANDDPEGTFDLTGCFFTTDRSDSAFLDREPLRCPLSFSARQRLMRLGWPTASDIPAAGLAGKFWWVRGSIARVYQHAGPGTADDVQTTEALFAAIAAGHPAIVMNGPFETKDDGHYALDVAWESPGG